METPASWTGDYSLQLNEIAPDGKIRTCVLFNILQDAAGKRLISNTYGKGSSIKVSSEKLPLTVRIGMKANISEFTVNGKSIGVSSRFTVEK